ncbi:MAG TPA: hypothetical protein VJ963_11895 [Bacteroidales bacterium]|nr:hypothetical protein [Bacteroidales bacterium]
MPENFKNFFIILIISLSLASCQPSGNRNHLFDANKISFGISPEKVIKTMGEKPDSSFNKIIIGKKRYLMLYFNRDSSEFRFDNNKRLVEVIVNKPELPFLAQTITEFGLPFREPSQSDASAFIEWRNVYDNFDIVNFYLVGDKRDNRSIHYKIYFRLKNPQ